LLLPFVFLSMLNGFAAQDGMSAGPISPTYSGSPNATQAVSLAGASQSTIQGPSITTPISPLEKGAEKIEAKPQVKGLAVLESGAQNEFQDFVTLSVGRILPMFGYLEQPEFDTLMTQTIKVGRIVGGLRSTVQKQRDAK
jgi:hypothetical protein